MKTQPNQSILPMDYKEEPFFSLPIDLRTSHVKAWEDLTKPLFKQGDVASLMRVAELFPRHNPFALAILDTMDGTPINTSSEIGVYYPGVLCLQDVLIPMLPQLANHILACKEGQHIPSQRFTQLVPVELYMEFFLDPGKAETFLQILSLGNAMALVRRIGRLKTYKVFLERIRIQEIFQERFPQFKWDFMNTKKGPWAIQTNQYIEIKSSI